MNDIELKLAKRLEDLCFEAMMGAPIKKQPQTALRLRGRSFETVELDNAGNVIEPMRCSCARSIVIHRLNCPFAYVST